jgi:hypothetical protein
VGAVDETSRHEQEGADGKDELDVAADGPREHDSVEQPVDRPVDRFRRSTTCAVVAAGMLGLRDALEGRPEKEEVTIVNEAPAAPPRDLEVVLDLDHPERSVAVVRHHEDDPEESDR